MKVLTVFICRVGSIILSIPINKELSISKTRVTVELLFNDFMCYRRFIWFMLIWIRATLVKISYNTQW